MVCLHVALCKSPDYHFGILTSPRSKCEEEEHSGAEPTSCAGVSFFTPASGLIDTDRVAKTLCTEQSCQFGLILTHGAMMCVRVCVRVSVGVRVHACLCVHVCAYECVLVCVSLLQSPLDSEQSPRNRKQTDHEGKARTGPGEESMTV